MNLGGVERLSGFRENGVDRLVNRPIASPTVLSPLGGCRLGRYVGQAAAQALKRRTDFRVRECPKEVHSGRKVAVLIEPPRSSLGHGYGGNFQQADGDLSCSAPGER